MKTFTFRYKNITRELPVYEVGGGVKIAYLDTLSDFELVTALSEDMAALVCENARFQAAGRTVLFTAENKGVPFAYSLAGELIRRCPEKSVGVAIARKHEKKFFGNCISAEKFSITSEHGRDKLFVPEYDKKMLENTAVILVDDFCSTGASMQALEELADACGADIIEKVVAIREVVDETERSDVKYVTTLPVL